MNEDIVGDKSLGYTVPSRLAETWQLMLAELSCRTAIAGTRQRCKGSGLGNDEFQRLWGFNEFQHIPQKMSHLGKQETTNKLVMFLQAFNVFYVFFLGALKTKHIKTMLKPQKLAASFSQLATVVSFRVMIGSVSS